jgi:plasmid stabilization system protein ParE
MTFSVQPRALRQTIKAARWYDRQKLGLGEDFLGEIEETFHRIQNGPRRYRVLGQGLRRALVRRFPYAIYFPYDGADIAIIVVLHQRRSRESQPSATKD